MTRREFGVSVRAFSLGTQSPRSLRAATPVDQNTVRRRREVRIELSLRPPLLCVWAFSSHSTTAPAA